MFIKKRICTILSIALCISIMSCMLSLNVYAHNSDYLSGTYASTASFNHSNLKFQINPSAQSTLLTSSVYNSAFSWDGISSKVGNLSIAIITGSMPSMGFYPVNGQFYSDGTVAETIPYNSSGSIVSAGSDWHRVVIQMNTSTSSSTSFYASSNPTAFAKMTFTHEVGHALKLAHPVNDSSLSGHVYNGLPYAVMCQGMPNSTNVASTVTSHDKDNLKAKWGL